LIHGEEVHTKEGLHHVSVNCHIRILKRKAYGEE
jgi:hypothetical protein